MNEHTSLDGEIAIVTGGARGIGRAVVEVFVAHGAGVLFCDLDPDLGREVEQASEGSARFVRADVSVEADIAAVAKACASTFGPASILVNNAGVNANFDATTMTGDDWDRFMGVDLKSAWLGASTCCRTCAMSVGARSSTSPPCMRSPPSRGSSPTPRRSRG